MKGDRQQTLFDSQDESHTDSKSKASSQEASFLLQHLEVFNWGPFRGLHRADFDPRGTAIIGPTGSGKTTLVDALMTLLVAQPRYNLASTGGHESDRTLHQYVRGVLGGDGGDGRSEVARPGKTLTGICATYRGGQQTLRLAGLMWFDGTSSANDDLKRRWLFSLAPDQTLEQWLRLVHDDGLRELTKLGRETAGLRIFDSKKAYLAHARKFFDVGENAFTLLNRAAGLKQLNSIDEIFRDLVLDDRSAFDRAIEVAAEFDNLAAIHAELDTARRQQESLVPVAEEYRRLQTTQAKVERLIILKRLIPIWYALVARDKWAAEQNALEQRIAAMHERWLAQQQGEADLQSQVDTLRESYLKLGGNVIGELENTIAIQRERLRERNKHAADYRRLVAMFGLSEVLSQETLRNNQAALSQQRQNIQEQRDQRYEQALIAVSKQREYETAAQELQTAIRKVKERPGSNIPPKFQDFRSDLARQVNLADSDLPFLAELVEVKAEQAAWRGAIERAIGSERLRILVPHDALSDALAWVNSRDNRLHVRLQSARADDAPDQFLSDGFTQKLNYKPHRLLPTAQGLLASRDLHCVASAEILRTTEHGLTKEGTISGRHGRFEKQDQRRLDEDWMTGFDNKDQLEELLRQLQATQTQCEQCRQESESIQRELGRLDQQLLMVDHLLKLEFATIDVPGAEVDLARSEERLAALLDPNSDASQAKAAFDEARKQLEIIRAQIRELENLLAVARRDAKAAEEQRLKAEQRARMGLNQQELELAEQQMAVPAELPAAEVADVEREARESIDQKLQVQKDRVQEIEQRLIRLMEAARRVDTGALIDVGSGIEDIPHYLERLRILNDEALPEKRGRFLEYLNRSSDQGVTQLLASIGEEVDAIEQRIAELNQTLVKVDFRSGRYLQLQPVRITDERLRALDVAMRRVRSAALKDDGGESHYKALREMVGILREAGENRRLQASKALLDPRFRLQFFVVEVDRQTGEMSPRRTGSQSGSGGEKELMASHILTASLSYALCPAAATRPLYGTVVLDEAFSKSSPSAATRIIEALRIFGLHPIFVTPNKEIGLLKQHTRKVICVQRPCKESTLASITWERLEEMAEHRRKLDDRDKDI